MPLDRFFQDLLMLDQWDTCSPAESEEIAQDLDRALPTSFRFHKVETCALGDQKHQVAFFEWDGPPEGYDQSCFALIPGGTVTLGYDRAHPFVPTRHQQQSWIYETETFFHLSLDDFLDQMMTPLRRVTIHPFLLEVRARPLESPPIFHPEWGPKGGYEHTPCTVTHEKTLQHITRTGFRFPTADEWEYACAAGSRTLFRWGNDTSPGHLPLIGGREKLGRRDRHLRQNAFGLFIARHPYNWEFCAEQGVMRGGDGGNTMCAGAGSFAEWLTLASSYQCEWDGEVAYGAYLRRVFPLFDHISAQP